ncbi:unnamed protein product, partial [Brassica rapa subsp. trilocularis]
MALERFRSLPAYGSGRKMFLAGLGVFRLYFTCDNIIFQMTKKKKIVVYIKN